MPNRDGTGPCGNRLRKRRRQRRDFYNNKRSCRRNQECLRDNVHQLEE